jgi:Bacteriocin-protection, YdeI or OmpD-Associated
MDYLTFDAAVAEMPWGRAVYTILPLPDGVVSALGPARRVEGEIAEHPVNLAITRAPVWPGAFLWAGRSLLDRTGIDVGQVVEVRLRAAPDDQVDLAPDTAAALAAGGALAAWSRLTAGKQRALLYQIDNARTPATRAKRIAALVAGLAGI